MNGLYNGAGSQSHRARIPSVTSINITDIAPYEPHEKMYSLDVIQGVYYETIVSKSYEVIQRVYAHRTIPQLIVTEIELARADFSNDLKILLSTNEGEKSADIVFTEVFSNRKTTIHKSGKTKISETSLTPPSLVHLYYDEIPKLLQAPSGVKRCQWFFIASIGNDKQEVEHAYQLAVDLIRQNNLFASHVEAWSILWKSGRIDMDGNAWISKAIYGSLYYILSSLPLKDGDETGIVSFVGLSPTGLAHGNNTDDYLGHVFWDQETWMFPSILMLHPDLAKTMLKSRIRTRLTALEIAKKNGMNGSQFPWESAVSGYEVSPSDNCSKYEIHVNGDIALALQQYIHMTNNRQFLADEEGKHLAIDIARYWASRAERNNKTGLFEVHGVMGPDEYYWNVNNSAYTNSICKLSLELAQHVCQLLNIPPDLQWDLIGRNMYVPFDTVDKYHPEFDGYNYKSNSSSKVKQADVVMLGFPLGLQMSVETQMNDLLIYAKETDLLGPSMTWSMYSINWLQLKDYEKGEKMFNRNFAYIRQPFQIWTEVADGTGAVNFITGMGGFLQNVLFGYGGLRINKDNLELDPTLPRNTNSFNVTGLDYLGSKFDLIIGTSAIKVIWRDVGKEGPQKFILQISASKWREDLVLNKPVSIHREKAAIFPVT